MAAQRKEKQEGSLLDVVEPAEGGELGVNLNDDLVSHLNDLRGGSNGSAGNNGSVLQDLGGFDNSVVEFAARLVLHEQDQIMNCGRVRTTTNLGVPSIGQVLREHGKMRVGD